MDLPMPTAGNPKRQVTGDRGVALVLQELSCYGINSKYFEEHRGAKKEHSLRSVTDEQRRGTSKDDELYRMNLDLEALVLQELSCYDITLPASGYGAKHVKA